MASTRIECTCCRSGVEVLGVSKAHSEAVVREAIAAGYMKLPPVDDQTRRRPSPRWICVLCQADLRALFATKGNA